MCGVLEEVHEIRERDSARSCEEMMLGLRIHEPGEKQRVVPDIMTCVPLSTRLMEHVDLQMMNEQSVGMKVKKEASTEVTVRRDTSQR